MSDRTQGIVLALLGAVCVRISVTDVYLRYVNEWTKWPLLLTGAVFVVLAARTAVRPSETGAGARAAWLLLAPALAVFVISPPALGSYAAERHDVELTSDDQLGDLAESADAAVDVPVSEFLSRAQWDDTLTGRSVRLTGFVTHGDGGAWFVVRMGMSCCAADVLSYRVQVDGASAPPVDSWIQVTGSWDPPADPIVPRVGAAPVIAATEVEPIQEPRIPYE